MNQEILVSVGRVVYVNFGPDAGKLAVIVDIVNGKRVIIDGPSLGVKRQMITNKRLTLTRFYLSDIKICMPENELLKKIKEFKLVERFNATSLGKRIQKQNRRANLTDFERFKVMCLKKQLGKALRTKVNANRAKIVAAARSN